jgi:excisionase family DNA binding protein
MLTIAEVARELGLSTDAVYGLCRSGKLAHYRIGERGGTIKVKPEDVTAYLASCRIETAQARKAEGRLGNLKHIKV